MIKPTISPNFTIDDIHKIREYNYEETKNMNTADRNAYYEKKAENFKRLLHNKGYKQFN